MSHLLRIILVITLNALTTPALADRSVCPRNLTAPIAQKLIDDFILQESYGIVRPFLANKMCSSKDVGTFKVIQPKVNAPETNQNIALYYQGHEIKELKRIKRGTLSEDYKVKVVIKGQSPRGKPVTHTQTVYFSFPRGGEEKLYGCVLLNSLWEKNFLRKECEK